MIKSVSQTYIRLTSKTGIYRNNSTERNISIFDFHTTLAKFKLVFYVGIGATCREPPTFWHKINKLQIIIYLSHWYRVDFPFRSLF